MTSHELARELLSLPDLKVVIDTAREDTFLKNTTEIRSWEISEDYASPKRFAIYLSTEDKDD